MADAPNNSVTTSMPAGSTPDQAPVQTADMPKQIPPVANTPQTPTAPASPANSNAPDADTKAGNSVPPNLINNPAAPTQKMATMADLNKTSDAPLHSWLYRAAQALSGGPQYTVSYDADGNAHRTEKQVSPAMIGAAIALHTLSGGLQGMAATGPGRYGKAAEIGANAGQQQVAQQKAIQANTDETARKDQAIKLSTLKTNLETRQLAQNIGTKDLEMNKTALKAFESQAAMVEAHPGLIKADLPEDKIQENALKYPAHDYLFIPHGEPYPIMETTGPNAGRQKEVNGVKTWGNNYYVVPASAMGTLTKEIQDQAYKIGKMRGPDGQRVSVSDTAEYPMSTLAAYSSQYAKIQTAEEMLDRHQAEALGDDAEKPKPLADWAASDPRAMQAIDDYSHSMSAGGGSVDEVLGNMLHNGQGQSAQMLMARMGISNDDIEKAENQRIADAAEAKNVKSNSAELDAQKRLDILTKDPITAANADSVIAAHNKPTDGVVIPEDRYNQAIAFNAQKVKQKAAEEGAAARERVKAESDVGDIPSLAKNIVSGDFSKVGDVTSYKGGQRIALANALHDAAVAAGKNPNDFSPGALTAKADMYKDYHANKQGTTGGNMTTFDTFLGHAGDAMAANTNWKRTKSPLLNQPLNWIATNATDDPNYVQFKTALEPVRKEFMSFLNANRAEHEDDIKTMQTVLSDEKTPLQIETALKQLGKSADIRLAAMARTYQRTMGRPFEGLITPQGQAALTSMGIVPGSYSKVAIPGQKPFYVPPEKADAVKAKYPKAVITER